MTFVIRWLPLGHVTHGYRRVFIVESENRPLYVFAIAPMPYEGVYHVQQSVTSTRIDDPSLLWGLSIVIHFLKSGQEDETADDGFIQIRKPPFLVGRELLETEAFLKAAEAGFYSLEL